MGSGLEASQRSGALTVSFLVAADGKRPVGRETSSSSRTINERGDGIEKGMHLTRKTWHGSGAGNLVVRRCQQSRGAIGDQHARQCALARPSRANPREAVTLVRQAMPDNAAAVGADLLSVLDLRAIAVVGPEQLPAVNAPLTGSSHRNLLQVTQEAMLSHQLNRASRLLAELRQPAADQARLDGPTVDWSQCLAGPKRKGPPPSFRLWAHRQ